MVLIEDEILRYAKLTEQEIRTELAILLYAQKRLSFGQARKLAGMTYPEFEKLLFERKIVSHYDIAEFEEDLKTMKHLHGLQDGSSQ